MFCGVTVTFDMNKEEMCATFEAFLRYTEQPPTDGRQREAIQYSMMCLAAVTPAPSPLGSSPLLSSVSALAASSSSWVVGTRVRAELVRDQQTATAPCWNPHNESTDLLLKLGAALLAVRPRSDFVPVSKKDTVTHRALILFVQQMNGFVRSGPVHACLCTLTGRVHCIQTEEGYTDAIHDMLLHEPVLTQGSSPATPPAGWIWERLFPAELSPSPSE